MYTQEVGVTKKTSNPDSMQIDYPTTIHVYIQPEHTGHSPEDDNSVNMLKLDDRVRAKIHELAANLSMPLPVIYSDLIKFADGLTAKLDYVHPNTTNFFPTEATVFKIVRRYREHMQLDPQDHLATMKFIEEDKKANPGGCLLTRQSLLVVPDCMLR